ncbi:hypothetical protein ACFWNK_38120 [Streptomyces sp. NPDC058417]
MDWFNQRRLHGELGHITPAEHETAHYTTAPLRHSRKPVDPLSIKPGA